MTTKYFYLLFLLFCTSVCTSQIKENSFAEIRRNYEKLYTDDESALPFVRIYIKKAKNEKNYRHWVQGYRDGVQFSKNVPDKMKFADSTITVAILSKEKDLIANAYLGKGIVYYFNFKKFQPALIAYLKALEFAEETKDEYLKNKIVYHIGVVKSYLGFYEPAAEHFLKCIAFFEKEMSEITEPITHFNNKKAYLNSLHQLTIVYRNMEQRKQSDSLIKKGLYVIGTSQDFRLEKAYFYKCRGIAEYQKENYNSALFYLDKALPVMLQRDDFAWASVIFFYKGNILWNTDQKEKAIRNFENIDTIFVKRHFIWPELRPVYEKLIMHAEEKDNIQKERYYTRQLLNVDAFLKKDFAYLSSKIYKGYDRKQELQEKKQWQTIKFTGLGFVTFLGVMASVLVVLLVLHRRKKKEILQKYMILQEKWENQQIPLQTEKTPSQRSSLPEDVVRVLTAKLSAFESNEGFRKIGLTVEILAKRFGTNSNYLSVFIYDTKGLYFKPYLMHLRINYIIRKLNEDENYLKLKITVLAKEAGFLYRQNFSDAFLEITGMRPIDYVKQKKLEAGLKKADEDQD
ncbi:helix-turn-helix domain-containing protein [Chryseobacterium caseinilyticum]|uniref:AraC family transcriptional regulator n=1 Tax=Chryseobacterium caseinilyticum TaxID=2771428 RepID=A0ABR8ZHE4_9FLAO|nr:AraC family transcriptional regulator [Chryseobacterium caseinilyticum]MBD8084642.1 AraC family transcriptional regulator [Chryseobacterium caseinilyticum]